MPRLRLWLTLACLVASLSQAAAQTHGGILRVTHRDDPSIASIVTKAGPCWWPRVHGIRIAVNPICNHWRFDNAWLDR
jgi:hypothetical protein